MSLVMQGVRFPIQAEGPVRQDPRAPYYHLVPKDLKGHLEFRRRMIQFGAQSPKNALALKQICAQDILFYINVFVITYDPRRKNEEIKPFNTYLFQDSYILDMVDALGEEDLLIEKSRDMGASWICLMVFEWYFHFKGKLTFLLVSRVEDLVDKTDDPDSLMWKIDFAHENMPAWMRPNGGNIKRSNLHMLNPENGATIDGCSTTKDIARGGRRTAILLDEFASVKEGDEVLHATRDATDCRIFNSTPKPKDTTFRELRDKGDIKIFRFHWTIHPVKARGAYYKEKVVEKDELGRSVYRGEERRAQGEQRYNRSPWYDLQCKRAKDITEIAQELDINYDGANYQFFDATEINRYINEFARPPSFIGDVELDIKSAKVIRLKRNPFGPLRLWCQVDINGLPVLGQFDEYVIGADISTGRGASNSVLSIGHKATGEKIGEFAQSQGIPEHKFAVFAVALAKLFGNLNPSQPIGALLIWESNGPGLTFGDVVMNDLGYRDVYYRKSEDTLVKKRSDKPGWNSSRDTKRRLLGEYRSALGSQFLNRSREAMKECLSFIFDGESISHSSSIHSIDPSGARSNHGDRVIADALCWKGIKESRGIGHGSVEWNPAPPQNSFGGRRQAFIEAHQKVSGW